MKRFAILLASSVVLAPGQLLGQTTYFRVLNPPRPGPPIGKLHSRQGPAVGGAQGSSGLFPVVDGNGWTVDMGKGALSLVVPVATVPGEMPIPVTFRYSAANAAPVEFQRIYASGLNNPVTQAKGVAPLIGTGGAGYFSGCGQLARPIFGK